MKKCAFILSYIALTTGLWAEDFNENYSMLENPQYHFDGIDNSCSCRGKCGNFGFGGDWLYWKVAEQQLQVGAVVNFANDGDNDLSINSKVLKPKFEYKNGFRVFGNYQFPCGDWKLEACYTHMPSQAGFNHVGDPANITFNFISLFNTNFPLLNAIANNSFSSVRSRWNVDVDTFDFDLSKRFTFCGCFEIKPHLGIRGQWIKQTFMINGIDTIAFTSKVKGKLKGIGIEGGFWGGWNIGCGLAVVGHLGGSVAYASSNNSGTLVGTSNTLPPSMITISYSDKTHLSLPTVDSFIGLAYTTALFNTSINLHVGWEHHLIFNTNQFSISGGGDMTLQGLTAGGSISF